jgi:hypothetical protein
MRTVQLQPSLAQISTVPSQIQEPPQSNRNQNCLRTIAMNDADDAGTDPSAGGTGPMVVLRR